MSLFWYVLSERRRRFGIHKKERVADESSFFGHFDDIENPALKIPDFTMKSGPRSSLPHSVKAKPAAEFKKQPKPLKVVPSTEPQSESLDENSEADEADVQESAFTSELDRKLSSLLPDMPEETKTSSQDNNQSDDQGGNQGGDQGGDQGDGQSVEGGDTHDDDEDQRLIEEFLAATAQIEKQASEHHSDVDSEPKTDDAAVVAQSDADDTYDEDYDEDERRVKDLLEQIKKDMREQGEHT